jgi:hypothetical protein
MSGQTTGATGTDDGDERGRHGGGCIPGALGKPIMAGATAGERPCATLGQCHVQANPGEAMIGRC